MEAEAITRAIARWPDLADLCERLLAVWSSLTAEAVTWNMDERTTLTVVVGQAEATVPDWRGSADAWFLDGFAPARNPDMWSAELMQAVARKTRPQGRFASYTAAGWVRRNLQAAGFDVEKRPGFGGKRDMICGQLRSPEG